nr:hypothetical protein [Tanacetum cinerariifolium]
REKEGHSDCDFKRSVHQADHPPSSEDAQSKSSPKSVGKLEAEEVPAEEPHIANEDADF